MKILVLSDSHGMITPMQFAVEQEQPDYVIHLGDCTRDIEDLWRLFPMLPVAQVRGNCDYGEYDIPEQRVVEYSGVKFLLCHGHRFGVKSGLLRLSYAAMENQVTVALFGHTHQAFCEVRDGVWLLNPGSCGYGGKQTYGIVEIKNGQPTCCVKIIDERKNSL